MFYIGMIIILSWLFCFFYYRDIMPPYIGVWMVIAGLFSMGWGLLKGKNY